MDELRVLAPDEVGTDGSRLSLLIRAGAVLLAGAPGSLKRIRHRCVGGQNALAVVGDSTGVAKLGEARSQVGRARIIVTRILARQISAVGCGSDGGAGSPTTGLA